MSDILYILCEHDCVDATIVSAAELLLPNKSSGSQVPSCTLSHHSQRINISAQTSTIQTLLTGLSSSFADMMINLHFHYHTYPRLCIKKIHVAVPPSVYAPTVEYADPPVHVGQGEVGDWW